MKKIEQGHKRQWQKSNDKKNRIFQQKQNSEDKEIIVLFCIQLNVHKNSTSPDSGSKKQVMKKNDKKKILIKIMCSE